MQETSFSDRSYQQYLRQEKLMGSRCGDCDTVFVPPRSICIHCHGFDMDWVEMQGTGKLAAFTCIAIGPPFMIAEGYNRKKPYCSGVVELDEGARVVARIEGVDVKSPENIKIGMPLKADFLHRGEDDRQHTYLAFKSI
jgi:uncharacterized OB-fold protein